jgi:hypothetical protein
MTGNNSPGSDRATTTITIVQVVTKQRRQIPKVQIDDCVSLGGRKDGANDNTVKKQVLLFLFLFDGYGWHLCYSIHTVQYTIRSGVFDI